MASKFIVFCALFVFARAGNLLAPAAYSAAPAVSTVYSSLSAPVKTLSYAAPAVATYSAAPAVATYSAGPAIAAYHAAPAVAAVHAAPYARYSPASAVSTSYSSIASPVALAAPVAKTLTYAAPAPALAFHTPAYGSSSQNIIRSFDGTVSQHAKAIDTAFSSVRKIDTRVNNNVYTPAIAKTLAYAAPAPSAIVTSHAAPAIYAARAAYAAPAAYAAQAHYAAPAAYATQAHYAAPAAYATQAHYAAPAAYATQAHYAAPAAYAAQAHYAAPAAYAAKTVAFSPASSVAHVSFDGYGSHYAF